MTVKILILLINLKYQKLNVFIVNLIPIKLNWLTLLFLSWTNIILYSMGIATFFGLHNPFNCI